MTMQDTTVRSMHSLLVEEFNQLKTIEDKHQFYTDKIKMCVLLPHKEAGEFYRNLYRIACAQGHLNKITYLTHFRLNYHLLDAEAVTDDYVNLCAQQDQLDTLKYVRWTFPCNTILANLLNS